MRPWRRRLVRRRHQTPANQLIPTLPPRLFSPLSAVRSLSLICKNKGSVMMVCRKYEKKPGTGIMSEKRKECASNTNQRDDRKINEKNKFQSKENRLWAPPLLPPLLFQHLQWQAQEGEAISSVRKEKPPMERQKRVSGSQRLRSPIEFSIKSPGLRIVLSPRINRAASSPSPSPSPSPSVMLPRKYHKRRKLTSAIWNDFEAIYDGNSVSKAECIHCHKRIKVARTVGTSTCLRHLRTCEGKAKLDELLNQMNPNDLSVPNASLKDWKFDQEKSRQELVSLIVVHALPFSLVEYPRFRSFVSILNSWFTHVSRTTIKSDCMRTYDQGKAELHELLSNSSSRVSLTADLWTPNQTLGYLCVTCHFIRNWKLYKRVIKFALVETPHDGRNLFNAMLRSLNEWNIDDKVFAITLDNSSNSNNFVSALKENLVAKHFLLGEGKMFDCRCAARVLNLIVQEGLAAVSGAITSIRDSVKYVKSSQGRKQRFEKMIHDVGISCEKRPPLDVVTRWNSMYHMLECALKYKRAFEALTREDFQYMHEPLVEEWKIARKLCDILKNFCAATKVLSDSKYPTSSLYFDQIWDIKLLLEDESSNPDVLIAGMVHEMKGKFEKYWDLCFLQICIPVIVDPRFKLGYLKFRLRQGFGDASSLYFPSVEKTFRELFEEYSLESSNLSPAGLGLSQMAEPLLQNTTKPENMIMHDESKDGLIRGPERPNRLNHGSKGPLACKCRARSV